MPCRILSYQSVMIRSLPPVYQRLLCIRFYASGSRRDPYEVLNVKPGSSKEEIKIAYLDLSKKLHPDVNIGDPNAKQKFVELNAAYSELTGTRQNVRGAAGHSYYREYQSDAGTWRSYGYYNTHQHSYQYDYFSNWKTFLKEKKESDDPFWVNFFRQNTDLNKTSYYSSNERVRNEYSEWLRNTYRQSNWYGNYKSDRGWDRQEYSRTERSLFQLAYRNVWFRLIVILTLMKISFVLTFGLREKLISMKIVNSDEYKKFRERLKEEEEIDGPYSNHKDRKQKQKKRWSIEDDMKEISYLHQTLQTKRK